MGLAAALRARRRRLAIVGALVIVVALRRSAWLLRQRAPRTSSVAVIVVPPFAPSHLRRPRCRRPARARARARPSPASGRSPRSCAAGSSPRSSTSTARRRSSSRDSPADDDHLRLPAARRLASQRHRAIPSRSSGPGYRGLLTSGSTRIDGLVSLADIAPTAKAIAAGEKPRIRSRADATRRRRSPGSTCRLTRAHDARTGATLVLVGWLVAFSALGILARRPLAGPGRRARRAGRARRRRFSSAPSASTTRRPWS